MIWLQKFLIGNWSRSLWMLLPFMTFLWGFQVGETRVMRKWDGEKQIAAVQLARLEQHELEVAKSQEKINKEISNEYRKKTILLSARHADACSVRMCNISATDYEVVPSAARVAAGVDASRANVVSLAERDEMKLNCDALLKDATQTTLMLHEIQQWYSQQIKAVESTTVP